MKIADDCAVFFHYTLTNGDGDTLDTSDGGEPLGYLHGHGNIIPGLESALLGKATGDVLDVVVEPKDGYGEFDSELVQTVPRSLFENAPDLEEGMMFQARTPSGAQIFTITKIGDEEVTIDGNHALAGETLHFHVEVAEVRAASDEEKSHGHLHQHGGCGGCGDHESEGGCGSGGCNGGGCGHSH